MTTNRISPHNPPLDFGAGRVWLVAALCRTAAPADRPAVRDDLMRTWLPVAGAAYRSSDGKHQATWAQLHAQFDLVEVYP